uniref:Major facilitator superfamily (MFS) profile domain-containing protein n=1 Tax=Anopheles maculatus TaxID=74869 RepID=A0A182TBF3_9DIPT
MLNGTSFISMRSIASKLVASDELGKVNSLFGVAEALMPLVYAPLYTTVYSLSINVLPGAFFLLGGALTSPAVVIFLWMYRVHRREARELAEEKRAEDKYRQLDDSAESNGGRTIGVEQLERKHTVPDY